MRFQANAVENKNIEALQAGDRFVGDKIKVGCVGEIVESVCDHGKLAVDDLERSDLNVADAKRGVAVNRMRDQLRQAATEMGRFENVLEYAPEVDPSDRVREYRHRSVAKIQRTNIIKPENVIYMTMRDQNRVDLPNVCAQCLLSEIC
jgi:hypothetical protein